MNEISPVIINAIELLKNTQFGEIDVKLLSTEMIRSTPTQHNKIGLLGVKIEIEGQNMFLTYQTAEDMLIYGRQLAEEIIYPFMKERIKQYERLVKLNDIKKNIKNASNNSNE